MEVQNVSFQVEISRMMFGFGDSDRPNGDTVSLVESIVRSQLRLLLEAALPHARDTFTGKELVFLMRRDKQKMRRLVQYLRNRDLARAVGARNASKVIEIDIEPPKNELLEFVAELDESAEFMDAGQVDQVKLERMMRSDRISQALDEQRYLDYTKARSTSFANTRDITRGMKNKLKVWLDPGNEYHFLPNATVMLSYLAYQMVADIVDYALLVRADWKCAKRSERRTQEDSIDVGSSPLLDCSEHTRPECRNAITVHEVKEAMRRIYSPTLGCLRFDGVLPATRQIFVL